jgi:hypothetical protein
LVHATLCARRSLARDSRLGSFGGDAENPWTVRVSLIVETWAAPQLGQNFEPAETSALQFGHWDMAEHL